MGKSKEEMSVLVLALRSHSYRPDTQSAAVADTLNPIPPLGFCPVCVEGEKEGEEVKGG